MAKEQITFSKEELDTINAAMEMLIRSTQRQINTRTGAIAQVFEHAKLEQTILRMKLVEFLNTN